MMIRSVAANRLVVSVSLALTLASRGTAGAEGAAPELHVFVQDCVGLNEDFLRAIQVEVEHIYTEAGVRIVWLEERPPDPVEAYQARAFVLEELPPSLRRLMSISKGRAPLAITLGPRPTEPSADIYVSRKAVLGRASYRRALAEKHMARALGRTLAHELAHRFLRSSHTEQGVLKATLEERDLIDSDRSDLFWTAEQRQLLQATAMR
ncbi:MAG TPA: hypothetical protein VEK15_15305 [Vicinamibacteria bacterium]|nr:hypothetical protein [Vicinamibacteria bacterium]